jgi:ribosomal-protein-alanine N-acetyltransferase
LIAELGRFVVRDLDPWEGPRVFRLTGDPVTTKYMGFRTHETVDEAYELILRYRDAPGKWLAVCHKDDPTDILGIVGFEVIRHSAALTIMFRHDWKARGAGREFSVSFVNWILSHPTTWRVWAFCHVDNVPVQRVLERMGAEREGRLRRFEVFPNLRPEPQDVYVYSIVRK